MKKSEDKKEKIFGIFKVLLRWLVLVILGYASHPVINSFFKTPPNFAVVTENIPLRDHGIKLGDVVLPSFGSVNKGTIVQTSNFGEGKKMYFQIEDWAYDYQLQFLGGQKAVTEYLKNNPANGTKRPKTH